MKEKASRELCPEISPNICGYALPGSVKLTPGKFALRKREERREKREERREGRLFHQIVRSALFFYFFILL